MYAFIRFSNTEQYRRGVDCNIWVVETPFTDAYNIDPELKKLIEQAQSAWNGDLRMPRYHSLSIDHLRLLMHLESDDCPVLKVLGNSVDLKTIKSGNSIVIVHTT